MPDELIYLSFLLLLVNVIALALPYQKAVPFPQKFGSVLERGHDIAVCSSEGKNGIVCFLTNWGGGGLHCLELTSICCWFHTWCAMVVFACEDSVTPLCVCWACLQKAPLFLWRFELLAVASQMRALAWWVIGSFMFSRGWCSHVSPSSLVKSHTSQWELWGLNWCWQESVLRQR